jgi:hypothetical protein
VATFAKVDIFRCIKFINGDKELEGVGDKTIGKLVTSKWNIREAEKEGWWRSYKPTVFRAINARRNDFQMAMKKVVMGKEQK